MPARLLAPGLSVTCAVQLVQPLVVTAVGPARPVELTQHVRYPDLVARFAGNGQCRLGQGLVNFGRENGEDRRSHILEIGREDQVRGHQEGQLILVGRTAGP